MKVSNNQSNWRLNCPDLIVQNKILPQAMLNTTYVGSFWNTLVTSYKQQQPQVNNCWYCSNETAHTIAGISSGNSEGLPIGRAQTQTVLCNIGLLSIPSLGGRTLGICGVHALYQHGLSPASMKRLAAVRHAQIAISLGDLCMSGMLQLQYVMKGSKQGGPRGSGSQSCWS